MKLEGKVCLIAVAMVLVGMPLASGFGSGVYDYVAEQNKTQAWADTTLNPRTTSSSGVTTMGDGPAMNNAGSVTVYPNLYFIRPFPVKANTTPQTYLQTGPNVDNVTAIYNWTSGPFSSGSQVSHFVNDTENSPVSFGQRWANNLPNISNVGTQVNVTLIAKNTNETTGTTITQQTITQLSDIITYTELPQHDTPGPENYNRLHYYIFNDRIRLDILPVTFNDQDRSDTFFDQQKNLAHWHRARETDINAYYGGPRGLNGQLGYDLYMTTNTLPSLPHNRTHYTNEDADTDRDQLINDAVTTINYTGHPNYTLPYLTTHPGPPIAPAGKQVGTPSIYATMTPNTSTPNPRNNNTLTGDGYGTWSHEIGHYLSLPDLYSQNFGTSGVQGGINFEGIMALGEGEPGGIFGETREPRIPAPFSSLSLTQNLFDINQNAFLTENIHTKTQIENNGGIIQVQAEALLNKSYGDSIHVIDTEEQEGLTGPAIYYNIEARGTNQHDSPSRNTSRVIIYRKGVSTPITGDGEIVEARTLNESTHQSGYQRWLEDTDEYILDLPTTDSNYLYNFSITNQTGTNMTYDAWITVDRTLSSSGSTLATMTTMNTDKTTTSTSNEPLRSTEPQPDRDLLAIDTNGHIIGPHPKTGKYVNQIPGARASGDRHHGMEWILLPDGVNATFYVHSTNTTSNTTPTSNTTLTITHYGNHAQLKGNTVTNTSQNKYTLTPQPNTYTDKANTTSVPQALTTESTP